MNLQSIKLDALKRPVVLITVGGVLLIAVLWWMLWMSPESNKLSTVNNQDTALGAQLGTYKLTLSADEKQQAKVHQYAGYLQMFADAVPPIPEAPQLTTDLANLADATHVTLVTLNDDSTLPGVPMSTIPLTMEIQGPRQSCIAFLQGLYSSTAMPRLVTVDSFTPTPKTGGSAGANVLHASNLAYTASITATAYFDPAINPSGSTPVTTTTVTG